MTQQVPFYFGTESEFALLGERAAREQFVHELSSLCKQRFAAIQAHMSSQDLFLPWGRLYVDVGLHPEWATAEVTDPWIAIYFQKVGEHILSQIADDFSNDIVISRHNVDCLSETSWGHHENYLTHGCSKQRLAEVLIPHLVTRIIYTGAGGLNIDFSKKTCQFVISPRSAYLKSLIHSGSQSNRPLFHLKNEPLCSKFGRLHLICGENLYSETASFLKIATTALLVILTDHQKTMPICETLLNAPLHCMQNISRDISLKKKLRTKSFKYYRALDIQWQYLEYVYSKIDQPFMPPWARFTCELWQQILQNLEKGWMVVSQKLDWAIKLEILEKKLHEWGFSFFKHSRPLELTVDQLYELFQFDLSYSQLGRAGLLNKMDNNGALEHHVAGTPSVRDIGTDQYPVMGRASVRAEVIHRLSKQEQNQFQADWDSIRTFDGSKKLDLDEVDNSQEKWKNRESEILSRLTRALKIL